jgi:hypothetical protein
MVELNSIFLVTIAQYLNLRTVAGTFLTMTAHLATATNCQLLGCVYTLKTQKQINKLLLNLNVFKYKKCERDFPIFQIH